MEKKVITCPKCGRDLYHHDGRATIDKTITCRHCQIMWRIDVKTGKVTFLRNRGYEMSGGRVLS